MKHVSIMLLFLICAGHFAEAATMSKLEFLKKFPLKEGRYETVVDPNAAVSFCENEELDIALHETDGELVLTIGPKLVFPDLQKSEATSKTAKDCTTRTTNVFSDHTLKQDVSETCGKKQTYNKTHVLRLDGNVVHYEFSTPGHKAEKCQYKFVTLKEGSP